MRHKIKPAFGIAAIIFITAVTILSGPYTAAEQEWHATGPMILVYMDESQTNHLRAYGLAYWCLQAPRGYRSQWLLNYRGGSFLFPDSQDIRDRATILGVAFRVLDAASTDKIYETIKNINSEVVALEKAPKIAVYVPPTNDPWDDAVRMVLEYAKIPYDTVWDREVIAGKLAGYDWLHLHHEDFTGQYGKFYGSYRNADWYNTSKATNEKTARELGFQTVPQLKSAVSVEIRKYVEKGGFLFAMCSAPDSLDISLSARGLDIVPPALDGTPMSPGAQSKLNFDNTFSFMDFTLVTDPNVYEVSDIDIAPRNIDRPDLVPPFELFEFSAKQDTVLSIFVQNHTAQVRNFLGQTTAFRRDLIKDEVVVLGDTPGTDEVKYVHGTAGLGSFTFLGGHDPEDFAHYVGEKPTDLSLYPNSPGYRLILNNVLFPSVKKKEKKT